MKLVESGIFGDSRRTSKVPIDQNCTRDNINYELLGAEVSKVVERIAKN